MRWLISGGRKSYLGFLVLIILCVACLLLVLFVRPLPKFSAQLKSLESQASNFSVPWPSYGQSSIIEKDLGLLGGSPGLVSSAPMASTAKIVTAIAVVKQKPLSANDQGPTLTLTQADVDLYHYYSSHDGSVVAVKAGEQISEYQMLESMMLPSANNIADTLAIWAFGSIDSYITYANNMLQSMHLTNTKVADANGFTDGSVSTAEDLAKLAQTLMNEPVLAQIVGETSAVVPVAGKINNLNWLLGTDGVVGVKTGNTDKAGGCFVFAANRKILDKDLTFYGAVMGAPSRNQAIADSKKIIQSMDNAFENRVLIKSGTIAGSYTTPWGFNTNIVAPQELSAVVWKGWDLGIKLNSDTLNSSASAGKIVGKASINVGGGKTVTTDLVLEQQILSPSIKWRIFRQ